MKVAQAVARLQAVAWYQRNTSDHEFLEFMAATDTLVPVTYFSDRTRRALSAIAVMVRSTSHALHASSRPSCVLIIHGGPVGDARSSS
eukprot:2315486-Pyramimonas_sp.AAC.1